MIENKDIFDQNHINKIKELISSQTDEIKRIHQILSNILEIYKEYINISKEYSKNLENLALKLKPDGKTLECQLVQAFQSILLFKSNSLNEMTEEMNNLLKNNDFEDIGNCQHLSDVYIEQYNKTLDSYKLYESGVGLYEDFLINKELGLIKDETKNNTNKKNIKDSNNGNKINNNHNKNKDFINVFYDNHQTLYINQQKFVNNVRACNDILKSLFDYFSSEKNKMREKIFNYSISFNDNILSSLSKEKKNILNQKSILDNLKLKNNINELEEKQLKNHFLKPFPYSLKCLKTEEEKKENKNNIEFIIKNKNKLSVEQSLHILQIFRANRLLLSEQNKAKEKEEYNKQEISEIIDILFNKTLSYNEIHKQKIISLLNEKIYQAHFLKILNGYRDKSKFVLNKTALKNLGYIFQYLNELIIKNIDTNLFKLFFIMSLTFYYQDMETYKKYYLLRFVENHKEYKKKEFWENYLSGLIKLDIESSSNNENKQDIDYINFSNIISVTKSMSDFHLGKEFINEFLEDITKSKYNLNEEQKIQINYLIADNEYGSFNENDRSTLSTEVYELNTSSLNNNSLDNNSDNNLIRCSRNSSKISNNLYENNMRTSSGVSNTYNSNDFNLNRISNNSNFNNANSKLNPIESKNEGDEGSLESIELEEMHKNI